MEGGLFSVGLVPKLDFGSGAVFRPTAKVQLEAGRFYGNLAAAPRLSSSGVGYALSAAVGMELVKSLSITLLWAGKAATFDGAADSMTGAQLLWETTRVRVGLLAQVPLLMPLATSIGLSAGYTF